MAAVYGAAAPWLPLAFTSDAEVAVAVWALLPLVICMLPLNALVYVLDGILVGASDFKFLAGTAFLPGRQEPRLTPLSACASQDPRNPPCAARALCCLP